MVLQGEKEYGQPVTALFFGSFNPIHNGHVGIARYLLDNKLCDEVWFVVSPCNPFKVDRFLLPEAARLRIVREAIADDSRMQACDIEFTMPKPSYTVDTLRLLFQTYPDRKFVLVIGGDNVERFSKWKDYRWIMEHCPIFVYPRLNENAPVERFPSMRMIDAPLFPLSATEIREMILHDKDISGLIPETALPLVCEYYSGLDKNK